MTESADQPLVADGEPGVIHDPRAICAFNSSVRLAILDFLAGHDPTTATECAKVSGLRRAWSGYPASLLSRS